MELDPQALVAVLSGEATEDQRSLIESWRAASPANEREYQRCRRVWAVLGTVDPPTDVSAPTARPIAQAPPTKWSRDRGARSSRRLAAGALLAAAVLLIFFVHRLYTERGGYEPLMSGDVVTGPGEIRTVQLRDGTIVRLDANSRLSLMESRGPRDVYVEGRAYFVVPSGLPNPFRVHSRTGQVEVVGTRFDVAARGEDVQVLVVEGEVAFEANAGMVNLRKGEAATADEATPPTVETVSDVYAATAWIGNFAAYEGTPLVEIAEEFQRRFGFEIEIVDSALVGRTVSGLMRDQSVEDMAGSVCIAVAARCTFIPGGVRMELESAEPDASAPQPMGSDSSR